MRPILILLAALCLVDCAALTEQLNRESRLIDRPPGSWQSIATGNDRARLRMWRSSFARALASARAGGGGAMIVGEGRMLALDAALPGPRLPDGTYRCRRIKLGARSPAVPSVRLLPAAWCSVRRRGELQSLIVAGGTQRPVGMIFPNDALRSVFLGTLIIGDERRAMQYGTDPDRDIAGFVERVAPKRWRIILPDPRFDSLFEVIEIVPTG